MRISLPRLMAFSLVAAGCLGTAGLEDSVIGTALAASSAASPAPDAKRLSYADLADHVLGAPLIVKSQPQKMKLLRPDPQNMAQSGPKPGFVRMLVTAKVLGLIRGDGGIAPVITYLIDLPLDSRGKPPKWGKQPTILFARAGNKPEFIQLVSRNAQMAWSPELESRTRAIAAEALKADAPPRILGIAEGFHTRGAVEGEGESQIFLKSDLGIPVVLSVKRQPGTAPIWDVSLGEIVGDTPLHPPVDSLLWYRLACALPSALPPQSLRTTDPRDTETVQNDYRFILEALGMCARTL